MRFNKRGGRSSIPYNDIVVRGIEGLVFDVMDDFNAGRTHQAGNDRQSMFLFDVRLRNLTNRR